jgi:hypothetical protein
MEDSRAQRCATATGWPRKSAIARQPLSGLSTLFVFAVMKFSLLTTVIEFL